MSVLDGTIIQAGWSGVTHTDIANKIGRNLNATEQSEIDDIIASIEDYIARQCKRQFLCVDSLSADQQYYETFNGGIKNYYPFSVPLKAVVEIDLDGVAVYKSDNSVTTWALGTDFFVYPERIQMAKYLFSSKDDRNAVKITYTITKEWGKDVVIAIKRWAAEQFLAGQYGGKDVTKTQFAGIVTEFSSKLPEYIESIIAYYKKYSI